MTSARATGRWNSVACAAFVAFVAAMTLTANDVRGQTPADTLDLDSSIEASDIDPERITWHVPDPSRERPGIDKRLAEMRLEGNQTEIQKAERALNRVDQIRRDVQLAMTLEDCIYRFLKFNYGIQAQSFSPAIETTRVVEAEAQFDAVFYANISKNKIDRPTASQLAATEIDQFNSTYGIRKTMATGTQIQGSWDVNRQRIPLQFQLINPEYTNTFSLEIRQPLLRGFGIDFNRSQIRIAKNNRALSDWTYRRQVRDSLRDVEELYWRLVQARRDIAITVRLLGDFEAIYRYLVARSEFDVIPVQLEATKSRLERERANFARRRATVFDAEQRLLAVLNDPDLPIGGLTELVPQDFPQLSNIQVDTIAEVQTALDRRPELKEQELTIANARIAVGQARNLELPRVDVTFRYSIDGLGMSQDQAFSQMSSSSFQSYFVFVDVEIPIGNRAARAATTRSQLQRIQAERALQARMEEIILDVHVSARNLLTTYEQIGPSFESAESREREVASIVARAERKDINTLNSELGAREALAAERRAMLSSMVEYNIAIIDLERAKGTLLEYNNVVLPFESDAP
ncbi:MAG: TolC family protein [Phycisphaerae bacterium]